MDKLKKEPTDSSTQHLKAREKNAIYLFVILMSQSLQILYQREILTHLSLILITYLV